VFRVDCSGWIVVYSKVRSAIILGCCRIGVSLVAAIGELSSRTLLAIIIALCSPNSLWRLQSPNHSRTFGYKFGYRHQFGSLRSIRLKS
jgi:hypothetical protein